MGKVMYMRKGESHSVPLSGILASDIAVGSSVYLMENGSPVEYLVVNQGIPSGSSLYDASCDGTWLLRKDCYLSRVWDYSEIAGVYYNTSNIHTYLTNTFFAILGDIEQATIKQAIIPYDGSNSDQIYSGANGLSVKCFLLSAYELGWTSSDNSSIPPDGACLSYFSGLGETDAQRIGYYNNAAVVWWLRSPLTGGAIARWCVSTTGRFIGQYEYDSYYIRPALILPNNALFDKNTLILKGVS